MNERPSVIHLTAADRELIQGGDDHDTPFLDKASVVLCHGMSPELTPGGSRFAYGAAIGDWVVPQGDAKCVFKNNVGFVGHIVGFSLSHPEYTVGVGNDDRGQYVDDHGVKAPEDTKFLYAADGLVAKTGYYRIVDGKPGNKVVPTIVVYMLVNGFGVTYSAYGTAFPIVRDLVIRAERLRATICAEGESDALEVKGCTIGLFRFTSRFEKKAFTYPVPVITLVGKLGDANGPPLNAWRLVQRLRKGLKSGDGWVPPEAIDVPAPPPEALAAPRQAQQAMINGVVTEIRPPPHQNEVEWELDDEVPW
jgi:hypothetical protein